MTTSDETAPISLSDSQYLSAVALLSATSWALNPVFCQVVWKCRLISNAHI